MDWLKLFALLVAVASVQIVAEGPKKKIRIHLPEKVKHIHHHKKIYITNHQAPSQYAPAYLPSAEGAVAVPTNVALPAVASIVPLNSVELYEESQTRLPGVSPAASKLLPLYRARGYYGPTHSELDEQEYDLAPPAESTDHAYVPTAFSAPAAAPAGTPSHSSKRVKIVKVNDRPRKKVVRKVKPKRVVVRGRPQVEDEHPVSTYHEQFYSDVDGSGTIRKIKKPQRVEKIIDGDTEHIHTYSEEHIHKIIFDEAPKISGVVGVDPVGSMSGLAAAHPIIPLKNGQTLLAIPSDSLTGFTAVGSLGTPSHLEYAAYNPRDVTHDHIFHDHGEISSVEDITKDTLAYPPKVSYNSQGLRVTGTSPKRLKSKYGNKPTKPTSLNDFSYYESIYTPYNRIKKVQKPTLPPPPQYESATEANIDTYRPIPSFKYKEKRNNKPRQPSPQYFGNGKQLPDFRLEQASVPAPFSVSSTIVHDYNPKGFSGSIPSRFSKFKDPFVNFKDSYSSNFDYDTYASSSNLFATEDKNDNSALSLQGEKGKKSISTQNISFGRQDHQNIMDHLEDSSVPAISINEHSPTALEHYDSYDQGKLSEATPTVYTIRETSPAHPYYTAMAKKALQQTDQLSVPEASNDNFHYAEAPTPSTTPYSSPVATTVTPSPDYFEIQSSDPVTPEPQEYISETRQRHRPKSKNSNIMSVIREPSQRYSVMGDLQPSVPEYKGSERPALPHAPLHHEHKGKLKYGDKI